MPQVLSIAYRSFRAWGTLAALASVFGPSALRVSPLSAAGVSPIPPLRRSDPFSAAGADTPAAMPTALRRVALLAPAETESETIQRLLETERKAKGKRQRFSDLFAPALSNPPAGKSGDAANSLRGVPLRALAEALFCDTLARQLRQRLDIRVVPESETQGALKALRLSPTQAAEPAGAWTLCARLDCDAVLAPQVTQVVVREGKTRDLVLWAAVHIAGLRSPDDRTAVAPPTRRGRPGVTALPPEIMVASAASSGRRLFRASYVRTRLSLVDDAAQQAALRAVHTLWTGDSGPFMQPGDRIAVAPVPAPTQADQLLFTLQGRHVRLGAVRGLHADVSDRFTPDLLPLFGGAVVTPEETRRALLTLALMPAALWAREDMPDIARVQSLGRKLGVDYLLLAHVTDIEMEAGASEPQAGISAGSEAGRAEHLERVARAETTGALVRIRNGTVLWKDRASATMTVRPEDSLTASLSDRQVAEDAVHFALLELHRRFRRYRASFER